ncbi:regulator of chromosome condensation 1/beta-lactamase-inhibitor protein II [Xylaria bambusicola]|uniref:regulator of chromosome condensation 1/beta-lactamase-inhibitor protein II n=1 Tax=Xylaria bambusicola TaxID=326684 RepID=UPI0020074EEC|nr:regulator of chromosome condensation 1/beta-lactamase-inhibitor protein II [Xylaria bambusicola]KAI0515075.1 regulator of chromosome condensation 1/beta-lactamase-inhibitor protein II [Xylaria bambusicola]
MAPRAKKPAAAATKSAPAKATKSATATRAKATTAKATSTTAKTSATSKSTSKAAPKSAPKSTATAAAKKDTAAAKKSTTTTKTKTATTKKATATKSKSADKPVKNTNGKRPIDDDEDEDEDEKPQGSAEPSQPRPVKKARVTAPAGAPTGWQRQVALRRRKRNLVSNPVPTVPLDVFVFGEGSSGELGLGSKKYDGKKPIDVKRPRINHNLDATKVGIVDIACGGMHTIALTKDNRVLTWGVNDDKALGRDTTWSGGVRDVDDEESDDDDDDDTGINPLESTPTEIEKGELGDLDIICKVVATDSASFVLTADGFVFGWGTFRGADGIIGFAKDIKVQPTPMLISPLQDITNIACGSNHVVAMDVHGKVWTWGSGGQFQLGRKPLTRHGGPTATLQPEPCGMFGKRHYAVSIAAGSYHSFYIDNQQRVWSWGLNNYSQTGQYDDTGKDDAMVLQPKLVDSLKDLNIDMIAGGEHHTVARTKDGKLLTWGRVDGHQVGQPSSLFNEDNAMFDENKRPRILLKPTAVPDVDARFVTAGVDTSFAIDVKGRVYSWGFSANYQTGQGTTDDIEVPTVIDNSAIRDREIVWAGAGGQYSIVAAEHGSKGSPAVNGVNGH